MCIKKTYSNISSISVDVRYITYIVKPVMTFIGLLFKDAVFGKA